MSDLAIQEVSPMQMIQVAFDAAIKQGSAMDVVNAILEQQKWMIQHSEEEAFNSALKRIQKRLKNIPKRGWNPETRSNFATAEDVDKEIQGLLDAENMTLSFRPVVSQRVDEVVIVGLVSLGAFTREYPLNMPADGKGAKGGGVMSRTHATGAAITYGKRYLKNMIFDLRFGEKDDDGNGASGKILSNGMEPEEIDRWVGLIESAPDLEKLKGLYTAAYKDSEIAKDQGAKKQFIAAKDRRRQELS